MIFGPSAVWLLTNGCPSSGPWLQWVRSDWRLRHAARGLSLTSAGDLLVHPGEHSVRGHSSRRLMLVCLYRGQTPEAFTGWRHGFASGPALGPVWKGRAVLAGTMAAPEVQ